MCSATFLNFGFMTLLNLKVLNNSISLLANFYFFPYIILFISFDILPKNVRDFFLYLCCGGYIPFVTSLNGFSLESFL